MVELHRKRSSLVQYDLVLPESLLDPATDDYDSDSAPDTPDHGVLTWRSEPRSLVHAKNAPSYEEKTSTGAMHAVKRKVAQEQSSAHFEYK